MHTISTSTIKREEKHKHKHKQKEELRTKEPTSRTSTLWVRPTNPTDPTLKVRSTNFLDMTRHCEFASFHKVLATILGESLRSLYTDSWQRTVKNFDVVGESDTSRADLAGESGNPSRPDLVGRSNKPSRIDLVGESGRPSRPEVSGSDKPS
jgi:hypothetical protein